MLVFLYPEELLSCILTDWLDLEDVTRLDSAICSSQHRENFLSLLRDKCIFSRIVMHELTLLNYLISRRVMLKNVTISVYYIKRLPGVLDRICLWVHSIGDTLQALTLISLPAPYVLSFIEPAIHIRTLKLTSCEISIDVMTLLEHRQICELTINSCSVHELRFALELQKLKLVFATRTQLQNIVTLHRPLTHLRSLQLNGDWVTDELLIQFSLHCPNVVHLSVCNESSTDSAMITIMLIFHNLQSLDMSIVSYSTNHLLDVIAERHGHSLQRLSIHILTDSLLVDVHRLLSACLHLHTLYLSSFNAKFVAAVLSQQNLTLTSLFILSNLDRKSLQAIADHCKHIRVVGLRSLKSFDELSECKQLQKVYIRGYLDEKHLHNFEKLRNSWPKVQFIYGEFPLFDVMAYE